MLANAIYSVISPESCSSILWRDWDHKREAACVLKVTAQDLQGLGLVDEVVPEPAGGAHTDAAKAAELLKPFLAGALKELEALPCEELLRRRHERLRRLASFVGES
jgi:acetyl-CoA carboxylase carboxyl transferase subunit alpha